MKQFKRRTIALVLASVVTVVGAFGADNYKNSLMGLSFEGSTTESVNLTLQTKTTYQGNITPIRKDANTYVLTLPETNSIASTPDLSEVSSNIASVNIRTMPYSNSAKGYTRITIKILNPSISLSASNKIFINDSNRRYISANNNEQYKKQATQKYSQNTSSQMRDAKRKRTEQQQKKITPEIETEVNSPKKITENTKLVEIPIEPQPKKPVQKASSDSNTIYLWLWALLIVMCGAFFYTKAQNKMQEIAGEKINIDVDDKPEPKNDKNKQKLTKIKNAINTLDSAYSKTSIIIGRNEYTKPSLPKAPLKAAKPSEELNIVDLDELFQEHKTKKMSEEEENDALEEFLSGFSFDDAEEITEEPNIGYDEALYEKIISNNNIKFSREDIICISKLLDSEINDDTRKNLEKYVVSSPITKSVPKNKILEDLVTTYTVSQNITFSLDDIKTLNKLINIELDDDFITDLRINPQKTEEMEKDILAYGDKPKKPSEIITLNVKDMLPDLTEALKQQGNKKIESNRKAETIYYSEGYEVRTLSISDLPDLSIEINNKKAYLSKPSAKIEYVDTNYTIGNDELKISSELPDLKDVSANPEKYLNPKEKEMVVNESALLENINNIVFKPFYDGTNEFEVINDFGNTPSVSDIQEEFSQFDGFEIAEEESEPNSTPEKDFDDFESIYNNEFIDLDKPKIQNKNEKQFIKKEVFTPKPTATSADELMKKIEATRIEREMRKARLFPKEEVKEIEKTGSPVRTETTKCILDGETYTVVSSVDITNDKGFYLAKSSKNYAILSYVGNNLKKIKEYETIKSERIHARLSEKLPNGALRYLIRVGVQKIIVNVNENNIEYVMDLC